MVGRTPKSYEVGLQKIIYLPIFLIKYQPIIPKGARRTFHDGERLHRLVDTTLSHGIMVFEKDFPDCKERLTELGYKKIQGQQMTSTFPKYCPKCGDGEGHPNLQLYTKAVSGRYDARAIKEAKFKIYYNHNKPKYHQCYIGLLMPKNNQIKCAKGIDSRKMSPFYALKENEIYESPLPKNKMKKGKTLR